MLLISVEKPKNNPTSVVGSEEIVPLQLLNHFFHYFLFQLTLKLGLSYPPLAEAGIDALESWNVTIPHDVLRPYFKDILPCFDGYLKSTVESGEQDDRRVLLLYLHFFLPPSLFPFFLPSFHPNFLPSNLPSIHSSFIPTFLPS